MRPTTAATMLLAAVSGWLPAQAYAQHTAEAFLHTQGHDDAVRLTLEMDPAAAVGLGYTRAVDVRLGRIERRVGVHLDTTAILGLSSWDLSGGVTVPALGRTGFDTLVTSDLDLKLVQNDVHAGVAYGYVASVRPGWFGRVGYAAPELALHATLATTIHHRDAYRDVFPDVTDGTYLTGNLSTFLGGAAGVCIGQRVTVGARFAWRFARTFESYAPYVQPYTFDLELGARF